MTRRPSGENFNFTGDEKTWISEGNSLQQIRDKNSLVVFGQALEDASKRADLEAGLKEAEQRRLAELEETLRHLQMLLDEEKRARYEQEQARQLQQRLVLFHLLSRFFLCTPKHQLIE